MGGAYLENVLALSWRNIWEKTYVKMSNVYCNFSQALLSYNLESTSFVFYDFFNFSSSECYT